MQGKTAISERENNMQMTGNTVLITGGASGIGLALGVAMLAAGNQVIIAGRRQAALDASIAAHPGLVAYALDVEDPHAITTFAAKVVAAHPALNVLVNNAGIMRSEDLLSPPDFLTNAEAMIATNLLGPIQLTAALVPHLQRQASSQIINVTSGLAFVPLAMTPTYSATKAGLHSYTQSLRHQLRDTSIEVLELAPPMVQTDLMPGQASNPHGMPLADYVSEVMGLLSRTPTPDEICVERVQFLRQAEATGQFGTVFAMLNPA
jgi:uncharacterized oxidoreductase